MLGRRPVDIAGQPTLRPEGCHARLTMAAVNAAIETAPLALGVVATQAGMAELADAADSKSADRKVVGVRPPLPAPRL